MGKKDKRKKKGVYPKLTLLDHTVYLLGSVFTVVGGILAAALFEHVCGLIAFAEEGAIAYKSNASFLFALPFLLFLEISAIVFFIGGWTQKTPLFGDKSIRYGEAPFRKDCFPLFRLRKYKSRILPSWRSMMRTALAMWCALFVLLASLVPLSLFGREVLYEDNSTKRINIFNTVTEEYTPKDYAHLWIYTGYNTVYRGGGYWIYEITIEMENGKKHTFGSRDFASGHDACLDEMLEIKALFAPEDVTIDGAELIHKAAHNLGFNAEQEAKLAKLFSAS